MQISIRRLEKTDATQLSVIAQKTFYNTFKDTCTEEDMNGFLEENYSLNLIEAELDNPENQYYFVEISNNPIGYMSIKEDYGAFPFIKKWKALELKRLYVLDEYHGKGVAQQIMDYVLDFAYKNQFEVVCLGVWEYNFKALRFYQKYGFEYSGHHHPYPIGNTPQTDLWFWKFL